MRETPDSRKSPMYVQGERDGLMGSYAHSADTLWAMPVYLRTFIPLVLRMAGRGQCSPTGQVRLREVVGPAHRPTASGLDLNPSLSLSSTLFSPAPSALALCPQTQAEPHSG